MTGTIHEVEIAIVGGGPAGMCAAVSAASMGASVALFDRSGNLGGQLTKQTHMFFGSQKQYASVRGIDICGILQKEMDAYGDNIQVHLDATVIGLYEDGVLTVEKDKRYMKFRPKAIIVATGASEKFLAFPNNDLPGIYGAGAVQTLMNEAGVAPGKDVVMVGAGNIGLIVSYQLMQADINVKAIIDAAPQIGGYLVHASKIRRMGVPILTRHTVLRAHGTDALERITIGQLDENWQPIEGTETDIDTDMLCISVGLTPLCELLWQIGCQMVYVPELGGYVAARDSACRTSIPNIYVAGDVAGVEEASSAMVEGRLAGFSAARDLGYESADCQAQWDDCSEQLTDLRSGPVGTRIRAGVACAECIEHAESGRD